jgi:hypothetical protein
VEPDRDAYVHTANLTRDPHVNAATDRHPAAAYTYTDDIASDRHTGTGADRDAHVHTADGYAGTETCDDPRTTGAHEDPGAAGPGEAAQRTARAAEDAEAVEEAQEAVERRSILSS